jgi:hypothetical protein
MADLQAELAIVKSTMEKLKDGIETKSIIENGEKCKAAKKVNVKECYEQIFGAIKPAKSEGGGGANGCCTIF